MSGGISIDVEGVGGSGDTVRNNVAPPVTKAKPTEHGVDEQPFDSVKRLAHI